VLLCPLRRFVCRVNKWVERLQTPRRVRRDERRGCDRQIRVIWICVIIMSEQAVIRYPRRGNKITPRRRKGRRRTGKLTGIFARRFANPTKLVLALCQKRAERARIEQITCAKNLIYKEAGGHVLGAPWGASNEDHNTTKERGREEGVRLERHHTRTRSTHPPACSCAPQAPRRSVLACAAASAPSRATRRVEGAVEVHMRDLLGRGTARQAHSMLARRATRPAASVRIRLRTSGSAGARVSHQRLFGTQKKEKHDG